MAYDKTLAKRLRNWGVPLDYAVAVAGGPGAEYLSAGLDALDARIDVLEAAKTALEAAQTDFETRISALEDA